MKSKYAQATANVKEFTCFAKDMKIAVRTQTVYQPIKINLQNE